MDCGIGSGMLDYGIITRPFSGKAKQVRIELRRMLWAQSADIAEVQAMVADVSTVQRGSTSIVMTRSIASGVDHPVMVPVASIRQRASIAMAPEPTNASGAVQLPMVPAAFTVRPGGMRSEIV